MNSASGGPGGDGRGSDGASARGAGASAAGGVMHVAPDVRSLTADNAGPLTLDGTRSYLVGGSAAVLVDPGPAGSGARERWRRLAGEARVCGVLLTHSHPDHAAGAAEAAELFDTGVAASRGALLRLGLEGEPLPDGAGVEVDEGESRLRVLETPGHSSDHLCFFRSSDGLLLTGDLVLGEGSSLVAYPDGSVGDYLRSLERLMDLGPERILPGHGPDVVDAASKLRQYRDHRVERDRQVWSAVEDGARTVPEIRERVYPELPAALRRAAEATICAHLVHLREQARELPEITGWVRLVEG